MASETRGGREHTCQIRLFSACPCSGVRQGLRSARHAPLGPTAEQAVLAVARDTREGRGGVTMGTFGEGS